MTTELLVAKITEKSNGNGNYVVHLHETIVSKKSPLGNTVGKVNKYYMEVEEPLVNEGDTVKLELDDFDHVERSFDNEEGDTITCTWLQ